MPRLSVVVAVKFPDVPVTVSVLVPIDAELLAVTVSVLLYAGEDAGFGLNDAVTPAGRPDTERFTVPVNPYSGIK